MDPENKKFELYFPYSICNPKKFKVWPLAEWVMFVMAEKLPGNESLSSQRTPPTDEFFFFSGVFLSETCNVLQGKF